MKELIIFNGKLLDLNEMSNEDLKDALRKALNKISQLQLRIEDDIKTFGGSNR